MEVHGEVWTLKELFVFPNESIYWSAQIVLYPFMTGLVAGAFVLSSLYHLFGRQDLKEMARFSLTFSYALLAAAPFPILFHLLHPIRGLNVFTTPHFTSAIAAFGVVFFSYASIVASEIWYVNRKFFVESAARLRGVSGFGNRVRALFYRMWLLGAYDIRQDALEKDRQMVKVLAGVGIPVACFLHGYAGFIFGSVKANALWMTPLMPVIFILSAIVSGVALCMLTYIVLMEMRKFRTSRRKGPGRSKQEIDGVEMDTVRVTARYLVFFMIFAISLEVLDLVFREYTAVKSWDILRTLIYEREFFNIFVLQYGVGNLVPLVLLLIPRLTLRRALTALLLILVGVFMMRWNVVIGGQSFSLTLSGFMHYDMPFLPRSIETYKEGFFGILTIFSLPFIFLWLLNKVIPVIEER